MYDALIIGGDGQIGDTFYRYLQQRSLNVRATTRKRPVLDGKIPFDLRWPCALPEANATFFCTGINGFKPCEADPAQAERINVTLLLETARRIYVPGRRLVYLSSSAAETHPDTIYGKCKREAEFGFLAIPGAVILRFGPVAFPGRSVYPNDVYSPINLITLHEYMHAAMSIPMAGLNRITNRDWKAEEQAA